MIDNITVAKDGGEAVKANIVNSGNGKYIIYITGNVKSDLGVDNISAIDMPESVTSVTYTVTIPYRNGALINELEYAETGLAPYNPFIFVQGNKQHEVHLIDMAPTDVAATYCGELFGKVNGGDSSDGINTFYRSTDYYPFAINLNADGNNNASVWNLDLKAESYPIYDNYPKFNEWAKTGDSSIKWWIK